MAQRALWLPWRRDRAADAQTATAGEATTPAPGAAASANGAGATDELRARREEIARDSGRVASVGRGEGAYRGAAGRVGVNAE